MTKPYLTEPEVDEICAPLKAGLAQTKFLERLGLHVERKPNGRPLVSRSHFETVLGAGAPKASTGGPNWSVRP